MNLEKSARRLAGSSALATGAVSIWVLLGWVFDWDLPKHIHRAYVAMNPLTALLFAVSGIALWLHLSRRPSARVAATILSCVVPLVAFAQLLRFFGVDLLLDRTLFVGRLLENRMAPNTAASFFLAGIALVLLTRVSAGTTLKSRFAEALACLVFLNGLLVLTGYLFNVPELYSVRSYIPMAIHTGALFAVLSIGVFFAQPSAPMAARLLSPDQGGRSVRRLLPAVILVPLALGALRLYAQRADYFSAEFGVALSVVLTTLILAALVWICAGFISRTDREISHQKQVLESVIRSIGDGVVVCGTDGRFSLYNEAAKELTGLGRTDLSPEQWGKLYGVYLPDRVTPFPQEQFPLMRALKGESSDGVEQFLKNPARPEGIFISVTGRPIYGPSGEVTGAVATFRDATGIKQNEERLNQAVTERANELKRAEIQIQQLQKMDAIGTLAGGVAHDFNNLLGAMTMYCDLLIDEADNCQQVVETAEQIRQVTERGSSLTRQLLIFSRQQVAHPELVDVANVTRNLLKMLARLIGENVEIKTVFEPELWKVEINPGQLEQILVNLVVNARDAMPKGGNVRISIANVELDDTFTSTHLSVRPGPHVLMTVEDTGQGMPPAVLSRIFEPFYTTKPIGRGTGLGLSTVYGIVKQAGGAIWVYSEPGKGSVFKIYFPKAEGGSATEASFKPVAEQAEALKGRGQKVLLVEDEERLRDLFARVLTKHGYDVLTARDGVEAVSFIDDPGRQFDLLLTDVVMPLMGGVELAKQARLINPMLRVIYMSGYAKDADGSPFEAEASAIFMQKPFGARTLLERVREALNATV